MRKQTTVSLEEALKKLKNDLSWYEKELRTLSSRMRELELKGEHLHKDLEGLEDETCTVQEQIEDESALKDRVSDIAGEMKRLSDDLWMRSKEEDLPYIREVSELLDRYYKDLETLVS